MWHALDVIETVDTNNQLDAFELACECGDTLLDILLLEALDKLLGIDTDGEGTNSDEFAIIVDAVRGGRGLTVDTLVQAWGIRRIGIDDCANLQNSGTAAQEVPCVVVCVEANQVAVEDTQQKRFPDRQDAVDFTAGEGGVKKEANLDVLLGVADLLAQHLGKQHHVIIMNPDHISVLHILDNLLCEQAVDLAVSSPGGLVERDLTGVVVEKRPEDGVCGGALMSDKKANNKE